MEHVSTPQSAEAVLTWKNPVTKDIIGVLDSTSYTLRMTLLLVRLQCVTYLGKHFHASLIGHLHTKILSVSDCYRPTHGIPAGNLGDFNGAVGSLQTLLANTEAINTCSSSEAVPVASIGCQVLDSEPWVAVHLLQMHTHIHSWCDPIDLFYCTQTWSRWKFCQVLNAFALCICVSVLLCKLDHTALEVVDLKGLASLYAGTVPTSWSATHVQTLGISYCV